MLLMPNRKYFKNESKVYFDYHVHDYMDKMLALSLLKDDDYDDLVIPQNQYKDLLNQRLNPDQGRSTATPVSQAMSPVPEVKAEDDIRVDIEVEDEDE